MSKHPRLSIPNPVPCPSPITTALLIQEIRRVAQNTRYPVYNVNTGTVPSSIVPFLAYIAELRKANEKY
jgi:hypothetical protein